MLNPFRIATFLCVYSFSALSFAAPTTSYVIRAENDSIQVPLEAPKRDVPVCVVWPDKIGECAATDPGRLDAAIRNRAQGSNGVVGLGALVPGDYSIEVEVSSGPHRGVNMSQEDIVAFMSEIKATILKKPHVRGIVGPSRRMVNGRHAIWVQYVSPLGSIEMGTTALFVFGRDRMLGVRYSYRAEREMVAAPLIESMITKIRYNGGALGQFGKPAAEIRQRNTQLKTIVLAAGTATFAAVTALIWLIFRRKSASLRSSIG